MIVGKSEKDRPWPRTAVEEGVAGEEHIKSRHVEQHAPGA